MGSNRTLEDFVSAAMPYIGPMFAPPWRELPGLSDTLDLATLPKYIKELFICSSLSTPVALVGFEQQPLWEVAEAINAYAVGAESTLQTPGSGPKSMEEFVEEYCQSNCPSTFFMEEEDLFNLPDASWRWIKRASRFHLKQQTGTRLIVSVPRGYPLINRPQFRHLRRDISAMTVRIPDIRSLPHTIVPWFLKYLDKWDPSNSLRSLKIGLFYILFKIGFDDLEGQARRWIEHPEFRSYLEGPTVGMAGQQEKISAADKEPAEFLLKDLTYIDRKWLYDVRLGIEHPLDIDSLTVSEAFEYLAADRVKMQLDYARFLPPKPREAEAARGIALSTGRERQPAAVESIQDKSQKTAKTDSLAP